MKDDQDARRKRVAPAGKYEVGYGRPPKQTQFGARPQPNRTKGGPRKFEPIDLAGALAKPLTVQQAGKIRKVSVDELAQKAQISKALAGNIGALSAVIKRFQKHGIFEIAEVNELISAVIRVPNKVPFQLGLYMLQKYGKEPWAPETVAYESARYAEDQARLYQLADQEAASITAEELATFLKKGGQVS